jgi:hypothetical protein
MHPSAVEKEASDQGCWAAGKRLAAAEAPSVEWKLTSCGLCLFGKVWNEVTQAVCRSRPSRAVACRVGVRGVLWMSPGGSNAGKTTTLFVALSRFALRSRRNRVWLLVAYGRRAFFTHGGVSTHGGCRDTSSRVNRKQVSRMPRDAHSRDLARCLRREHRAAPRTRRSVLGSARCAHPLPCHRASVARPLHARAQKAIPSAQIPSGSESAPCVALRRSKAPNTLYTNVG